MERERAEKAEAEAAALREERDKWSLRWTEEAAANKELREERDALRAENNRLALMACDIGDVLGDATNNWDGKSNDPNRPGRSIVQRVADTRTRCERAEAEAARLRAVVKKLAATIDGMVQETQSPPSREPLVAIREIGRAALASLDNPAPSTEGAKE